MTNNHLYDLLRQLVQEDQSLYHIGMYYKKDSGKCKACQAFWKKMIKDKEDHIRELEKLVKGHMKK